MAARNVLVVDSDLSTGCGHGIDALWSMLMAEATATGEVSRFSTRAFDAKLAACDPSLVYHGKESLTWQMIRRLLEPGKEDFPPDTLLFLATTQGEIDLLERAILEGRAGARESQPRYLLEKIEQLLGLSRPDNEIVSAACASSTIALARAGQAIREGRTDTALVVACDAVTEFVFAGFSGLEILDPSGAHPFDPGREGLALGDGAAYALLASEACASRHGWTGRGELLGWGASCDAYHMTGPDLEGSGFANAIRKALRMGTADPADIGSVCAHGTATLYNDAMEMAAYNKVFGNLQLPVYSIKGTTGHTLGAAGLIETLVMLHSLQEGCAPPTVGLRTPDPAAQARINNSAVDLEPQKLALTANAGFGGINAALVLNPG